MARDIGAGDLRDRVLFLRRVSRKDRLGAELVEFVPLPTGTSDGKLAAKVEPLSANEQFRRQQIEASATWRVVVRFRSDIDATMVVQWKGHTFQIVGSVNTDMRREFLELACDELRAVPTIRGQT